MTKKKILHLIIFLFLLFSCGKIQSYRSIPMGWKNITTEFENLPEGIRVFSGRNKQLPINAWYVEVDSKKTYLETGIVISSDDDRKETPSQFTERLNASVVINGGYFLMHKNPAEHVGLLMQNGKIISKPLRSMLKREKRYFITRSAIGFDDGIMDIAWIASRNDSLFEWETPTDNSPDTPIDALDFSQSSYWNVESGLQAGPVINHKGRRNVTDVEEAFFWTKIPDIHPRSAAGYTKNGKQIFLVVDGRQPDSRGVDLNELAIIMDYLDCEEAINLDGGGSSALVVNGKLLNKPAGLTTQREVMSAIAVFSN
ncbi:MAG: phosphodiester glycosidase family protein [Candidatus Marinimicrobia bacterium]|nr:phosphodiester glycosidase family protein [Candidatus Neomarinimicrobiota bacterium]